VQWGERDFEVYDVGVCAGDYVGVEESLLVYLLAVRRGGDGQGEKGRG